MIGQLFNNRYQIVEKLGAGGTAIVYRGQDTLLNRAVTIKILREEYANNQEFVRRFNHEAQAVASLSHNNIVGVYDVGFEGNRHYIVMEFVEGESLKDYINRKGALEPAEACNIICQIMAGLQHAHEHGIIHRDIKSHNILLGKDGRAKVTDFGIAIGLSDVTLTYNTTSRIMGSVHYISPEQVQGLTVTERSDIYSAGVVFYEMLTGRLPFVGETPISIAMQHVQGELVLPHQINPNVPPALSYVVMRAMRKNPETRYASAAEMAEAVRHAWLQGQEVQPVDDQVVVVPGDSKVLNKQDGTEDLTVTEETPADIKSKRKLSATRIAILVAAAALVAIVVWVAGILFGFLQVRDNKAIVPPFVGMTLEEAQQAAEEADVVLEISYRNSSEYDEGVVMSQNVQSGQEVSAGRSIEIVVSEGQEKVEVPKLTAPLSQRIAELTLANLGLVAIINTEYNDEVPKGQVIMQSPAEGTMLTPGSSVTLLVSLGSEPVKFTMASLEGSLLEDAQAYASDNGLTVVDIQYEESYTYSYGQVIGQSIVPGTTAQTGDELSLTVSEGPGPTEKVHSVRYLLPGFGDTLHEVVISVTDVQGTREVYNQQMKGGNYISYDVTYYNYGTIRISIDGEEVFSESVS